MAFVSRIPPFLPGHRTDVESFAPDSIVASDGTSTAMLWGAALKTIARGRGPNNAWSKSTLPIISIRPSLAILTMSFLCRVE